MRAGARGSLLLLVGLLVGGAGGVGAGLVLGRDDTGSPTQATGPVTAPVQKRELRDSITLDCTVHRAARPIPFVAPQGAGDPIVTSLPRGPVTIIDGRVLAEVSGRPVITLEGPFRLYRDIGPGDSGRDVRMLQTALTRLGYRVGTDGTCGPATENALGRLYRELGYSPPTREMDTSVAAAPTPPAARETAQSWPIRSGPRIRATPPDVVVDAVERDRTVVALGLTAPCRRPATVTRWSSAGR